MSDLGRLDLYLSRTREISRTAAQALIGGGLVTVNGRRARAGQRVGERDTVDVLQTGTAGTVTEAAEGPRVPLDVVYEDDLLAVIDKPSGLVVHPAAGHHDGTLADGLKQRGSTWSYLGGQERAGIVHRLDRDVSGLLVVAKTEAAHRALAAQLSNKTMGRTYWAMVWGHFTEKTATIEAPIGRDPRDRKKMGVVASGRPSVTDIEVTGVAGAATILDVHLRTGRTHQIRVHLAYINHPIVGDPVYGRSQDPWRGRPALHARELTFIHPGDGEPRRFRSPLPPDLRELEAMVRENPR
jgi:23S rRNA pseudouridine1911/1915/1917 synthase